ERIDATAQILQIDEEHVERVNHRIRRFAHLAIETEDRDAVHRIVEVRRLDHIVLLVAAQSVLWTEGGGHLDVAARGKRIERMCQFFRDGGRMREQCYAFALERRAQGWLGDESIYAEFHDGTTARNSSAKQSA